jgi:hypothetical protein
VHEVLRVSTGRGCAARIVFVVIVIVIIVVVVRVFVLSPTLSLRRRALGGG